MERLQNINLDWAGLSYVATENRLDAGVLIMARFNYLDMADTKKPAFSGLKASKRALLLVVKC